jgi:hypothetical protein
MNLGSESFQEHDFPGSSLLQCASRTPERLFRGGSSSIACCPERTLPVKSADWRVLLQRSSRTMPEQLTLQKMVFSPCNQRDEIALWEIEVEFFIVCSEH